MTEKEHKPKRKKTSKKHAKRKHAEHKTHHSHKEEEEEKEILIEEGLEAIYGSGDVDFTKLDHAQNRLTNILLTSVVLLGVLAVVAWGGFFVYSNFFETGHDEAFTLEISMDEELTSGERTSIELAYGNPTTVPIAALEIDVNLPSTFVADTFSEDPSNMDDLIWEIGELAGISDGSIIVEGVWIAEVPSETPVQAYATFRPANFNADFEDIAVEYITTIDSVLETEIIGPEEALPGDDLAYEIIVTNSSEELVSGVELSLALPDGFYIDESEPALESGAEPLWSVEQIEAGATETISLTGSFAADVEGFQYIDATAGIVTEHRTLPQHTSQAYTDVLQSDLSVQLAANGATDEVSVDLGSSLRVSLSYENTGGGSVEDLSLLLDFQSDDSIPIDWNSASLDGGVITRDGIVWNASTLGEIAEGDRQLLNLSFPLDASIGVGDTDAFTLIASASSGGNTVRSSPISISINTEANFDAVIRYYDENGAVLGDGPIPPSVGETTTYRVFWSIENSLHDLSNVRISATLPPHVTWTDRTNANLGTLHFDSVNRTVIWTIDNLSTAISTLEANFAISITPDADDVGSFVKLLSASSFEATDTVTSSALTRSIESLTTEAPEDEFAAGAGIVVE